MKALHEKRVSTKVRQLRMRRTHRIETNRMEKRDTCTERIVWGNVIHAPNRIVWGNVMYMILDPSV